MKKRFQRRNDFLERISILCISPFHILEIKKELDTDFLLQAHDRYPESTTKRDSPQNVTEVIFGIISGVKDGVSLKENKGETMERCVVGKNGADFSAARDSGSLVFNETFQVVGLLTAGCDSVGLITYLLKIELDSILSKPPLSEYMEPNWHREIFEMDLENSKC
ncbi:hypothetical protein TWF106_010084 [Orbilia oligospora]|uniref:Uncharacterized protein n=1 Tax=Orbilia oligospora TaxID=2813651 RepID=A0A7C8UJ18_ORBOL|nr:hypothetical protein TWF106_010084 [Orbilia oligospora]